MEQKYIYNAEVYRVIDGDTIVCDVDLGFFITQRMVFRLYGINCPEIVGTERAKGLESKEYMQTRIEGKQIIIKTHKDKKEKYGRYLAEIYLDGFLINEELLTKGLAEKLIY